MKVLVTVMRGFRGKIVLRRVVRLIAHSMGSVTMESVNVTLSGMATSVTKGLV